MRFGLLLARQLLAPRRRTVTITVLAGCCHANRYTSLLSCSGEQKNRTAGLSRCTTGPKMAPIISCLFFLVFPCSILPVRQSRHSESPCRPRVSSKYYAMLQYSMKNTVSLLRRLLREHDDILSNSPQVFRGAGGAFSAFLFKM